jgi:hypothetical protein
MSVGGVFQLITNTGLQDKILYAREALDKRILDIAQEKVDRIQRARAAKGLPPYTPSELFEIKENWQPTVDALDRTHVVFINSSYKPYVPIAHEYSRTPPRQGVPKLSNGEETFSFTLPIIGEFVNDAVVYIKLTDLSTVSALDKIRYAEYLGHRLIKRARFKVQNHLIDEYGSEEYNAHLQFEVPLHKEKGYLRSIGQELPKQGYLTGDPLVDEFREYRWIGDGPQTYKQTHASVEMWIPLLFWFRDIKTALPNFMLPMNQTDIEITLESYSRLLSYTGPGGGAFNPPVVKDCQLYVNHIFLLPEIAKLFRDRFGFQLIRVHRQQQRNGLMELVKSEDRVLLHDLKFPIECLYVGFRPKTNRNFMHRWHRNTHIVSKYVLVPVSDSQAEPPPDPGLKFNKILYFDEYDPISSMSLSAHDITIYPELGPAFYNSYVPYQYGSCLKTPRDLGWYMMNFNLYPGDHQPSGHFNISRSRELYLKYTSALDPNTNQFIIRPDNPVELIVIAKCINFLLFEGNNMTLKFST